MTPNKVEKQIEETVTPKVDFVKNSIDDPLAMNIANALVNNHLKTGQSPPYAHFRQPSPGDCPSAGWRVGVWEGGRELCSSVVEVVEQGLDDPGGDWPLLGDEALA